jgi:hypothetical protein
MGPLESSFDSLPCAQTCRRIDFDCIEIREATRLGGRLLLVSGIKSWADLRVTLEPLSSREVPDFQVIEVVGRLAASGLPALVEFCVALPLESLLGRMGIEIIGATKSERRVLNLASGAGPGDSGPGRLPIARPRGESVCISTRSTPGRLPC